MNLEKIYIKSQQIENKSITKIILFIIIVFTLLPIFQTMNRLTNSVLTYTFFSLFFIESIFRLVLLIWSIQAHIRGTHVREGGWKALIGDFILWIVDLLATISFLEFLPFGNALRFLRLLRLIKLSRYFSSFFNELGQIINRRSIRRQFFIVFILLIVISFVVGLIFYVAEEQDVLEYTWWSFKTLFDPGEMVDYDALTEDEQVQIISDEQEQEQDKEFDSIGAIKLTFSLVLTIIGLLLLSFFIGIGTQVVENLIEITKYKKLNFKNHIIIFGWASGTETMINEILNVMEDNQMLNKLVLLQTYDNSLEDTIELKFKDVLSRYYKDNTSETLLKIGIEKASMCIIFGESSGINDGDSDIIKKILTVKEINNPNLYIVSLINEEKNRIPAREVGSDTVIVKDSFMGFYLCQNILKPDLKDFYQEVMTASGSEFYFQDISKTKLIDIKDKYISYQSLYMRLIEKECTFVGVIKKDSDENLNENIIDDIIDKKFIVNPMQYYDKTKRKTILSDGFYPKDIDGIVCLSSNGVALTKSMQEIDYNDLVIDKQKKIEEPAILDYKLIDKSSIGDILIFGWNNSIPSIIQQLSTYVSMKRGITIYLHSEYGYTKDDIEIMKKKIKELLIIYYNDKTIKEIIESIRFVIGDYYSQTDLFNVNIGNLKIMETLIVLPDNKKVLNPDADVFLLLLTLLGIMKLNQYRKLIENYDRLKVFAQVSDDKVGNKLDEILEKVNPKIRSYSMGKKINIDRFNILYSEKTLNYLLVQHITNHYSQKIFRAILSNDDMNSAFILSEELITHHKDIQILINQQKINYNDICRVLLKNRITPVGYEYDTKEVNNLMVINPEIEQREINIEKNIPRIIVIGNYENKLIKEYDKNRHS